MKNIRNLVKQDKMTFILCSCILIIALLIYLFLSVFSHKGAIVKVTVDGDVFGTYSLMKEQEVRIDTVWGYNILHIEDGYASVNKADCQNKVCIHTGKISKEGQTIVCLPHKVIISIESQEKSEVDAITN